MTSHDWLDRPTLVTGATGLVGSRLVQKLLDAGADVVCLVRDWVPQSDLYQSGAVQHVKIARGNLEDIECIERILGEYEIQTVFHLAAQATVPVANRNPLSTFESNIRGTWNLLETCRRSPLIAGMVIASSDKAYGENAHLPYTEDMPLQGRNPYDVSKSCTDLLAQSYASTYRLPIIISRCGNFYGEGDLNWNRIVPGTIRSILRKESPVIRSNGSPVRDYFYVEDGAAAYMLLAEHILEHPDARGEAFNFSNEEPLSVLDLVQKILRVLQSNLTYTVKNEASHEIPRQFLNAQKARDILHWSPKFSLDEGLRRTANWYRDYLANNERAPS